MVEKVVREACARSSDGKISITDFAEQASRSMRYVTFSPMEVSIIFHYAGQGSRARLGLKEFAQLLDPKWGPPKPPARRPEVKGSFFHELGKVRRIIYRVARSLRRRLGSRRIISRWEVSLELVRFALSRREFISDAFVASGSDDGVPYRLGQDEDAKSAIEGGWRIIIQEFGRLCEEGVQE